MTSVSPVSTASAAGTGAGPIDDMEDDGLDKRRRGVVVCNIRPDLLEPPAWGDFCTFIRDKCSPKAGPTPYYAGSKRMTYATLKFTTSDQALRAVQTLNGAMWGGQALFARINLPADDVLFDCVKRKKKLEQKELEHKKTKLDNEELRIREKNILKDKEAAETRLVNFEAEFRMKVESEKAQLVEDLQALHEQEKNRFLGQLDLKIQEQHNSAVELEKLDLERKRLQEQLLKAKAESKEAADIVKRNAANITLATFRMNQELQTQLKEKQQAERQIQAELQKTREEMRVARENNKKDMQGELEFLQEELEKAKLQLQQKEEASEKMKIEQLEDRDAGQCQICFERELDTALQPCGHMLCECCWKGIMKAHIDKAGVLTKHKKNTIVGDCPHCRTPVKNTMRVFHH